MKTQILIINAQGLTQDDLSHLHHLMTVGDIIVEENVKPTNTISSITVLDDFGNQFINTKVSQEYIDSLLPNISSEFYMFIHGNLGSYEKECAEEHCRDVL